MYRELRARGTSEHMARRIAANTRRWWRSSGMYLQLALPTGFFDRLGVPRLAS